MKKLSLLLCLCLLLSGCGGGGENETEHYSFIDDLGRVVTVESADRVACLLGSFADVWYLAGGTVVAAPDDAWDDFKLELDETVVNLGATKEPSLELLFAAEPDLVIASANTQADLDMRDTLEAAGITSAYFDVSDFEDYLRLLRICCDITGQPERYEEYGTAIQKRIEESIGRSKERINTLSEAPTVLYLRASAASIRAKGSEGNVLGEMLSSLGLRNIADSDTSLLENLSLEHIVAADPDYIFFVQLGDDAQGTQEKIDAFFADNPALQELTAVKEGRVYLLDKRLYNLKPNALWADAYEQLEELIWNG